EGDTFGQNDELPIFPNHFPDNVNIKIALFHGTMITSTMQNYHASTQGYPIDWFNGYDLVMLGDVHLQQIHNAETKNREHFHWITNKQPWGYAGSLIQQNFGEPIFNHGFLLWDIRNKLTIAYHVKNPYGFIYIKYFRDNGWRVEINKK